METSAEKENIIIVDDNIDNLRVLTEILAGYGYNVRPALNGNFALKSAENLPPDLFLLDINMPEMDGYEVCERLNLNDKLKDIPVIFISAYTETIKKVKAFELGGIDYITKPFQAEEIHARVKLHLKLRSIQKELESKNIYLEELIENLKNARVRLGQAEKMASLGVLIAGIAHEINNPINYITTNIQGLELNVKDILMLQKKYDSLSVGNADKKLNEINICKKEIDYDVILDEMNELTKNVLIGANRASEIVKSLRNFSHMGENNVKDVDLHENIDSTLIMINNEFESEDNVRIKKNYGKVQSIKCNAGKLNQVFMNILINAIQSIKIKEFKKNETITISTFEINKDNNNYIVVKITDTGEGVPDEIKDKIFDPFFTTKEVGEGSGMGLSISHQIVESFGGFISFENEKDRGSSFEIYLPLKGEEI